MKKLKGNSILGAFVFGLSLLMLCAFGTDACYTVLSRYKLQKITEAVAIEYAASKARDYDYKKETIEEKEAVINEIKDKYEKIYNTIGSGILVFHIESMGYKSDRKNKQTVVFIRTQSKVLPIFLKFAGVREIIIHSNACAKTERIVIEKEIDNEDGIDFTNNRYSNSSSAIFEFPFGRTDLISSKNTDNSDFMIEFEYEPTENIKETGGGFFILGGYKKDDEIRFADLGNKRTDEKNVEKICASLSADSEFDIGTGAKCLYCVNSSKTNKAAFKLTKDDEQINRINILKIYKAAGSAKKDETTGEINNPCNPDFIFNTPSGAIETPAYEYFNRKAKIKLTILNNITLIKRSAYNSFRPQANDDDNDIEGSTVWEI